MIRGRLFRRRAALLRLLRGLPINGLETAHSPGEVVVLRLREVLAQRDALIDVLPRTLRRQVFLQILVPDRIGEPDAEHPAVVALDALADPREDVRQPLVLLYRRPCSRVLPARRARRE